MINTILSVTAFGYNVGPFLLAALATGLVAGIYFGGKAAVARFSAVLPEVVSGGKGATPSADVPDAPGATPPAPSTGDTPGAADAPAPQ